MTEPSDIIWQSQRGSNPCLRRESHKTQIFRVLQRTEFPKHLKSLTWAGWIFEENYSLLNPSVLIHFTSLLLPANTGRAPPVA